MKKKRIETSNEEKYELINAWDKLDRAWDYIIDIIDYPDDYSKESIVSLTEDYANYIYEAREILEELGYKGEE